MPPERLAGLRPGDLLESPTFPLPSGCRGRFQLFPLGDTQEANGICSLWLCADAPVLENFQLRLGRVSRDSGASAFCSLEEALADGFMEVSLQLDAQSSVASPPEVEQSLFIEELQRAEWQLFQASRLKDAAVVQPLSSPPFRFHHVLLGDMYLELLPGVPHKEHCLVMFRCRVPTMQLQVTLSVGTSFSKTLIALGKATIEEDLKQQSFLQVNLGAPGVLAEDGSLTVRCQLDKVLAIPRSLPPGRDGGARPQVALNVEQQRRLTLQAMRGEKTRQFQVSQVWIFDTKSGACLRCFEGHGEHVYSACFSPNFQQVLTGSEDCTAKIFDL
eukprot:g23341.t1